MRWRTWELWAVALGVLLGAGPAMYATITAAVATGVLAGATGIAFMLDRDPKRPSLSLTVGPQGGGIGVVGAW